MANNTVQTFTPGLLPTASAKAQAEAGLNDRFSGGLLTPFSQLSIQGRQFALKVGANVAPFLDAVTRRPIPIEVVLVDSHPALVKRYFIRGYVEGDTDLPDCFSNDGVRPSDRSPQKQNASCGGCRWNEMRSARNADGSAREGKACADKKLLSIVFASDLVAGAVGPVQLQLPYTSHGNLAAYINYLKSMGYGLNTVITKLDFDFKPNLSYPVVTFNPSRALTDEEIDSAKTWRKDSRSQRIVASDDRASPVDPDLQPSSEGGRGPTIYAEAMTVPQPTPRPSPQPPVQAAPPVAPVVDSPEEEEAASEAPSRTDAPLPGLVPLNIQNMPGAYMNPQTHQVVKEDGSPYVTEAKPAAPSFAGTTPAEAAPTVKKTRARRATAAGEPDPQLQQSNGSPAAKEEKPADAPLPEAGENLSAMVARLSKLMPPPQ